MLLLLNKFKNFENFIKILEKGLKKSGWIGLMSENDDFEPEVINPNLTQDDVLSLSAVYGLTLNKRQKETAMKNDKLNQKYAGGSTPDLR